MRKNGSLTNPAFSGPNTGRPISAAGIMTWIVWFLAALVLVAVETADFENLGRPRTITLDARISQPNNLFHVFYDTGSGFGAGNSAAAAITYSPDTQHLIFNIPDMRDIRRLRIDPGSLPGRIWIRSMTIHGLWFSRRWRPADLVKDLRTVQEIEHLEPSAEGLAMKATGGDPQFVLEDFPRIVAEFHQRARQVKIALLALIVVLGVLAGPFFTRASVWWLYLRRWVAERRPGARTILALAAAAGVGLLGYFLCTRLIVTGFRNEFQITLKTDRPDVMELFYDLGQGFNLRDMARAELAGGPEFHTLALPLPALAEVRGFRLDPATKPGIVWIREVGIRDASGMRKLTAEELASLITPVSDIAEVHIENGLLRLDLQGTDPYFLLNYPFNLKHRAAAFVFRFLGPLLLSVFVFFSLRRARTGSPEPRAFPPADIALVLLFLAMLCLPLLAPGFPSWRDLPSTENRHLADKPKFQFAYLFQYPKLFEPYFNDHFFGRNALVRWNNQLKLRLFGRPESSLLQVGLHSWFFPDYRFALPEGRERTRELTAGELARLRQSLLAEAQWFTKRRLHAYVLWTPQKSAIYPEYCPAWFRNAPPAPRLEQIKTVFRNLPPSDCFRFLDVTDAVRAAKNRRVLYYRWDQHWNNYGAFIAYGELIKGMARDFPGLKPLSDEDVIVDGSLRNDMLEQDLLNLLNLQGFWKDDYFRVRAKRLDASPRKLGKVLILHDSQFEAMRSLIPNHFSAPAIRHHDWLWIENYYALIERLQPEAVVIEVGEPFSYFILETCGSWDGTSVK